MKAERPPSPIMDPALTDTSLHNTDEDMTAGYQDAGAALHQAAAHETPHEDNIDPSMSNVPMDWAHSHMQQPLSATTNPDHEHESEDNIHHASAMTTTTRRNANGSVSSVFSGNRIATLKKDDGVPLWRKDIQFLFLNYVFEDDNKVFTRASDGSTGHTFAEIYIDAMAKSSKCSQILKEKLLTDRASAIDMAMICLLVNVGRMNTTLNFFPEMRARVRTYHAIPCLQAQQGSQAYKQLQDGPRLKSILKGAMEDTPQPANVDDLLNATKPRTNPVNLIFVLSQYAPRVSETHFFPPRDFFDLFMRANISSRSRATAFLWLIWWYLESDFSIDDSQRNPFGPGISGEDGSNPIKVPLLEVISDEQADAENMDTEEEVVYGETKRQEREGIVANDMPPTASGPKKGTKTPLMEQQHNYRFRYSPYASDSGGSRGRPSPSPSGEMTLEESREHRKRRRNSDGDRTCSPSSSPQTATKRSAHHAPHKMEALLNEDSPSSHNQAQPSNDSLTPRKKGVGRGNYPRKPRKTKDIKRANQEPPLLEAAGLAHSPTNDTPIIPNDNSIRSDVPISAAPVSASYAHATHTPYVDSQLPYDIAPAPTSPDVAPQSSIPVTSGGANRTRARPPATIEQSRRERVNHALYHSMQELRKDKRQERRERGALVDAWLKCNVLPDGYDSAEDEPSRLAGIDEITTLHTINGDSGDVDDLVEPGDAGGIASHISRKLKRVALVLDGVNVPRPPKRIRMEEAVGKVEQIPSGVDSPAIDSERRESVVAGLNTVTANLRAAERKPIARAKRGSKSRAAPKPKGVSANMETPPVADDASTGEATPKKRKRITKKVEKKETPTQAFGEGQIDFSADAVPEVDMDAPVKIEPDLVGFKVQARTEDHDSDVDGTEDEAAAEAGGVPLDPTKLAETSEEVAA